MFLCLVICRSCTHGLSPYDRFIYERFVSNFCCSSPPKSSRCTSCGIQRSQPVIVDHLYMAIFVLNCSSSLAQGTDHEKTTHEYNFCTSRDTRTIIDTTHIGTRTRLLGKRRWKMETTPRQTTITTLPVVLMGSLNRADVDSLRFLWVNVVHNSDMLRWRHPLWWYSVHWIHVK